MENLLGSIIERKLISQKNIASYILTPIIIAINIPTFYQEIGNDYYFLTTKEISTIAIGSVKIVSSDNFFTISSTDYLGFNLNQYPCFRDYLEIRRTLPTGVVFTPYKLEFLKVTPTYKI